MAEKGFPNIVVYIDDFQIVESSYKRCKKAMTTLMQVLRQLGFRINYNKVIEPTQRLIFLGVTLNCSTMVGYYHYPKLSVMSLKPSYINL